MDQSQKKRWFHKHPTATLVVVILVAVVLFDLLTALIFIPEDYNSFRCPDPYFHHGLMPCRKSKNIWGERVFDIYTNSLGFKDQSSREVLMNSDKRRILFIGDSFTESMGMTWEESFTGILAAQLPDIEILNAGVVSYSPKLYYLKTKYLIEQVNLKFGELIVFIDNSDPLNELTYEHFAPYDQKPLKKFGNELKRFFFRNSYLYYSVSSKIMNSKKSPVAARWNPVSGASMTDVTATEDKDFIASMLNWSYTPESYDKWGRRGLQLAAENMQNLVNLCNRENIMLTVVIYPWPSLIEQRNLNDMQVIFWRKFCLDNNIRFVDLYPEFINGEDPVLMIRKYFIPGDVHWNQNGNRLIAEKLLEVIRPCD